MNVNKIKAVAFWKDNKMYTFRPVGKIEVTDEEMEQLREHLHTADSIDFLYDSYER